jgi:hypothetical protein
MGHFPGVASLNKSILAVSAFGENAYNFFSLEGSLLVLTRDTALSPGTSLAWFDLTWSSFLQSNRKIL